ncbi:hypothetical protein K488DRAFT_53987 [Vararia minispora EC-137]|uniref:Uncharacterized protein n=1 Tax=Vararia minispora EC-137 TaxID=1314806 RepID=A0ACB8QFX9_9AGAM|nr:hypothetical protein K488DRAFT_53987 [Vararia minispora EC-137]
MAQTSPILTALSPTATVARKPRTIVLCFDGTSNEYGTHNTNVVKFFSLLKKDRTDEQICYYQAGVGTYFQPGVVSPLFRRVATILDQAVAWYLSAHVMDGYRFLMQNYNVGDKVCMFGFSRGAYTARALAGMLHKIGLLLKDNEAQLPFAYRLFTREDPASVPIAAGFKRTFCRAVPIEFLGVWDTVASVGLFSGKTLPFVTTNTTIKTFRHAMALDERRAKFRANYYHRPVEGPFPRSRVGTFVHSAKEGLSLLNRTRRSMRVRAKILKDMSVVDLSEDSVYRTDAKEVWFVGGHGDVGGGVASDTDDFPLSNISLRWMVREAIRAQCSIQFDSAALSRLHIPLSGPDIERDVREIEQPVYDALTEAKTWWLLEYIPTKYTYQKTTSNKWVSEWWCAFHLGEGRGIPDGPLLHESVKRRMDNEKMKYTPRARWKVGTETYVD